MEQMGAMLEGEWNNLSAMYTTHEEADFMAQLMGNCSVPVSNEQGFIYDHNTNTTDAYSFSQGSSSYSNGSSILVPSSCNENYYHLSESHQFLALNNSSMSINFSGGEDKRGSPPPEAYPNNPMMEMSHCLNREMSSGSLELSGGDLPEPKLPKRKSPEVSPLETQKKRSRVSGDVQKKRNVKPKKNQKIVLDDDEENNAGVHQQNLASCCSEDESNASQELNGGASLSLSPKGATVLNSSGKTRASRGSATDPQSLYARKRRERINERLKVLQNLVPNGTKVDISTMLEEAVQYVKFLQLQIKLLSSDDMWMYAPLAYNGMDLGLDLKIGMPRS